MTRKHRLAHRLIWPALALAVCFGFVMALVMRTPAEIESPPAAQEMRK